MNDSDREDDEPIGPGSSATGCAGSLSECEHPHCHARIVHGTWYASEADRYAEVPLHEHTAATGRSYH